MAWVWFDMGLVLVWFGIGLVWYGMVRYGLVCSIMSHALLCFLLDKGLETFLEIRDLEIYILLIYMVTRLQNYRTYRLLALFCYYSGTSCVWAAKRLGLEAEAELLKLSSYDVW